METPAQYTFSGNGNIKIFPVATEILGQNYTKIFVGGIEVVDTTTFDIINNSIVFKEAPSSGTDNIVIMVASSVEALEAYIGVPNIQVAWGSLTSTPTTLNGYGVSLEDEITTLDETSAVSDADEFLLLDASHYYNPKKTLWSLIKSTLKTYFDTLYLALTNDQIVAGIKTFSSFPVTPSSAPTTEYQVANKKYVDDSNTTWVANDSRALTALNASGTAPIYACRAWVNFNGTGTVAIRGSGNVSSITDNGTGTYVANLTTAMPDVNFSVAASYNKDNSSSPSGNDGGIGCYNFTTTSISALISDSDSVLTDAKIICLQIFR